MTRRKGAVPASEKSNPSRRLTRRRFSEPENVVSTYREFSPTPREWIALEKTVKAELSSDIRAKITAVIERFMELSGAAQQSPFADDVEQEWARIKSVAEELNQHLQKARSEKFAETAILNLRYCLDGSDEDDTDTLDEFNKRLEHIIGHCANLIQQSQSRIAQPNEYDYWDIMVFELREVFQSEGLPDGISGSPRPSAFVSFIAVLQAIFPHDIFKREGPPGDALARMVKRSCDAVLDTKREEAERECPKGTNVR